MLFDQFGIDSRFLRILKTQGITEPTPIQAKAIPVILEGRDAIAIAQTGTGKTLAFALPALSNLASAPADCKRMLIITPTRELAHQINAVIQPFGKTIGLRSSCIYGGVGMHPANSSVARRLRNHCGYSRTIARSYKSRQCPFRQSVGTRTRRSRPDVGYGIFA